MRPFHILILTTASLFLAPQAVLAQRTIVEGQVAWAAFLDEDAIEHSAAGGGVRVFVLPRLAIGAEVTHMRGPGRDRDWFLMANTTFDLLSPRGTRRVIPYLVASGGVMRHSNTFASRAFSVIGPAATLGIGARIKAGERWFIAPEGRIGWEPHWRLGVSVGLVLRRPRDNAGAENPPPSDDDVIR